MYFVIEWYNVEWNRAPPNYSGFLRLLRVSFPFRSIVSNRSLKSVFNNRVMYVLLLIACLYVYSLKRSSTNTSDLSEVRMVHFHFICIRQSFLCLELWTLLLDNMNWSTSFIQYTLLKQSCSKAPEFTYTSSGVWNRSLIRHRFRCIIEVTHIRWAVQPSLHRKWCQIKDSNTESGNDRIWIPKQVQKRQQCSWLNTVINHESLDTDRECEKTDDLQLCSIQCKRHQALSYNTVFSCSRNAASRIFNRVVCKRLKFYLFEWNYSSITQ